MHLSFLADLRASDCPIDAGQRLESGSGARAHRDGLIRGVLFMAAIAVPFCLAVATGHGIHQHPSSGYAQAFAEDN